MWKCGNREPSNEWGKGWRGEYCENGHAMHAEWCRIYYQFSPLSHSRRPARPVNMRAGRGLFYSKYSKYIYYIHCI